MMLYIVFFTYSLALAGGLYTKPDSNLMRHRHSDSAMAQSRTEKLPRAGVQESPMV